MGNMASKALPLLAAPNQYGQEMAHHAGLHTSSEAVQNPSVPPQYAPALFRRTSKVIHGPGRETETNDRPLTSFYRSRDPHYCKG